MKLPLWGAILLHGAAGDPPDPDDPSGIVRLALGSEALIAAYAHATESTLFVVPGICLITAMALVALVCSGPAGA